MELFKPGSILTLMILTLPVRAGVADYLNVYNIPNSQLNFGTWAYGDGMQVQTATFCLASSNYNNGFNDPPPIRNPPAVHESYRFKIRDRSAPAGFFLYLGNDDSNTGNAKLAIELEHRDIKAGNSWETLADNVYDSHAHTGQFRGCKNGKNSQLRITITAAELAQARAGNYRGRFRATGIGGSSGTKTDSDNFNARIRVADIVRISNLSNVSLGTYGGGGDINVDESFCVYSNNNTAAYDVTITSPNQDVSDNFYLVNGDVSVSIPYTLFFKDSLAPGVGTEVAAAALPGNGDNGSVDCSGGDNAKISVRVLNLDLSPVPADAYSDTLTVLVSPI